MVATKTPPFKNTDKDDTTPVIRHQTIILRKNPAIPYTRLEDNGEEDVARALAFDAVTTFTPILTSSRKTTAPEEKGLDEAADDSLTKGIAGLSIGGAALTTPKKKSSISEKEMAAIVPDKVASAASQATTNKKQKDDDDDWIAPTESEDSESVSTKTSSDYIDSDADDDLDWDVHDTHNEFRLKDFYSPENATGSFHYAVLSPEKGVTINVRRSSRNSFGSRNSFSSPIVNNSKKE
uniref:Uncharacterized protein n=1 Tax=Amphora coffeiformis TaxID=265554 RepID=A0A7S3L5D9_9STRA|eukprot:scaffold1923_cov160-Amphora_coffeaeformis.AAC.18